MEVMKMTTETKQTGNSRVASAATKKRYRIRVSRAGESIGEYAFNATPEGLRQLKELIKPEFSWDILDR